MSDTPSDPPKKPEKEAGKSTTRAKQSLVVENQGSQALVPEKKQTDNPPAPSNTKISTVIQEPQTPVRAILTSVNMIAFLVFAAFALYLKQEKFAQYALGIAAAIAVPGLLEKPIKTVLSSTMKNTAKELAVAVAKALEAGSDSSKGDKHE